MNPDIPKRPRDDTVDPPAGAGKKPCREEDRLCLLNDIENDPPQLDEEAQEALISEIMKNLEQVIGNTPPEEAFPEVGNVSDPSCLLPQDAAGDSQVDLKYLLEASDDELGIPPSPNTDDDLQKLLYPDDISWLDSDVQTELNDADLLQSFSATYDDAWRCILALE